MAGSGSQVQSRWFENVHKKMPDKSNSERQEAAMSPIDAVDGSEIPFPTTWDIYNPINTRINLSTGAGFWPSTVGQESGCSGLVVLECSHPHVRPW